MEKEQDIDLFLTLPQVVLKNCFVKNEEREFYNILYINENLSFLLILTHECIWNETYPTMTMEQLYKLPIPFELFGFVITNSSLDLSVERFKTMMETNYASDIVETLEKWAVFRISYNKKGIDLKNPISSLKKTIHDIINKNDTKYI